MKLIAVSLTVALAGVGLWWLAGRGSEPGEIRSIGEPAPHASELALVDSGAPDLEPAASNERSAVSAAALEGPVVSEVPAQEGIYGLVVDEFGTPVEGAQIHVLSTPPGDWSELPERVATDVRGEFLLALERSPSGPEAGSSSFGLLALANGFLREQLEVQTTSPEDPLRVVLRQGERLSGRVFDEAGRPVPGLRLLAHTSGAPVRHVSPSRVEQRAQRARLRSEAGDFEDCVGVTDEQGRVEFAGLARDAVEVRSLDPGWSILEPQSAQSGERAVRWTATRRLGVQLTVSDARTLEPVDDVDATFRVELTFENGETEDYGQWVGGGQGGASFVLSPAELPFLAERTVIGARFYGTATSLGRQADWSAEPIESDTRATGVAQVRLVIDLVAGEVLPAPEELERSVTVELDVRYDNGAPYSGDLVVVWSSERLGRGDSERARELQPGRFEIAIPPGEAVLTVREANASGSLPSWSGELNPAPDTQLLQYVTLVQGEAVTLERPDGWSGEWLVHASWREATEDPWQGSWTYGTTEESLRLSALRKVEWRFALREAGRPDQPELIRLVDLAAQD